MPDDGRMTRQGSPEDFRYTYTPPSPQPPQQPYLYNPNGAYNGYSDGRFGFDYRDEQKRYRDAPRDMYGAPKNDGYRF